MRIGFARDEAGNQAKATFVDNVFEKPFKNSRIEIDDKFINRVVPEIIEHSPELKMTAPAQDSPEMLQADLAGLALQLAGGVHTRDGADGAG